MFTGLHVQCRYVCRASSMNLEFSQQIFEKYPNIKRHDNPSTGSRVIPCGQTDGQTDMTKLTVAFRHFVKAP